MFVAYDFFCRERFIDVGYDPTPQPIRAGLAWFEKNLKIDQAITLYYLYGIERVGMASGYKFFGRKDWYKMGAEDLLNTQRADGAWTPRALDGDDLSATSFAMLFLVRGRNPVLFNRLEYDGDWNNRPRALANLTRWMSRSFERDVTWQIVNLNTDVEDWHDAPILVITGSEPPEFSAQDVEKLRTFVCQGGMIFTVNEGKEDAFDQAVRGKDGLYARLFPGRELKELSPESDIFSCHAAIKSQQKLYGVSNGIRLMAVHCPGDLPLSWQTDARTAAADDFNLAANLVIYATDRNLRHRGTSNWPTEKPFEPRKTSRIARIEYSGNFDPEPLALRRFATLMAQQYRIKLEVEPAHLGDLKASQTPLAFLTGTGELHLSEQEKAALKAYAESGGTVVMDAAGGSEQFADSAMSVLADVFGQANVRFLPEHSPVLRLPGFEITSAKYRRVARAHLSSAKNVRLWAAYVGDRPAVFFAREDMTAGLTGYSSYTCSGYEPATAFDIVRNIAFVSLGYTPPAPPKK